MTAKYQLFKNPRSVLKEEREHNLYPRIVKSRIVRLEDMSEYISDSSTFTTSDILGAWNALKKEILKELKAGNKVDLEGLGSFQVILKCRNITDPKEIRAESIEFSKVSFTPAKELHRQLKGMPVERDGNAIPVKESPEIRRKRILQYLQQHQEITSSICMSLNKCSRDMAQKDLKQLYQSGQIIRHGGPKVSIYSLNTGK